MHTRIARVLGGLLIGAAIVVGVELALRIARVADDPRTHDPFAGFSSVVPMFEPAVRDDGTRVYRLSRARAQLNPQRGPLEPQREFLAEKPDDVFRIFAIGGSSAAGQPYSTRYAFSTWLERRLEAALPERRFEVVNAALAGYASRRLVPVVEEIAGYQPDLLIVYMGHNEWAETMYYEHLLDMDPRLFRLLEWVYQTRIYALVERLSSRLFAPDAVEDHESIEIEARQNSIQMFAVQRDRVGGASYPTPRELAYRDLLYENNLNEMARAIEAAGGRVLLVTLSQNFSDWPPPASLHRDGLSADEKRAFAESMDEGSRLAEESGDCEAALTAYARALEIDPSYADIHYRIASCHRSLGQLPDARRHYRRASDLDPVSHGAPTYFNDILRKVARQRGAILVDADAALEQESGAGLVGDDLFTDFAHPNLRAHQRIAAVTARAMREAGIPEPAERWLDDDSVDPDPESLYRAEPELRTLELESRVFVCLVAYRDDCAARARELERLDPGNRVAKWVIAHAARRAEEAAAH